MLSFKNEASAKPIFIINLRDHIKHCVKYSVAQESIRGWKGDGYGVVSEYLGSTLGLNVP